MQTSFITLDGNEEVFVFTSLTLQAPKINK